MGLGSVALLREFLCLTGSGWARSSKLNSPPRAAAAVAISRVITGLQWWADSEAASVSCRDFISTESVPRRFPWISGASDVTPKQRALWRGSAGSAAAWREGLWGRGHALVPTSEPAQHPGVCAELAVAHVWQRKPKGSLSAILDTSYSSGVWFPCWCNLSLSWVPTCV